MNNGSPITSQNHMYHPRHCQPCSPGFTSHFVKCSYACFCHHVSQPVPPEMRWPYRLADLGSAIGLAPQSPGLLVCLKVQMGIIVVILAKGREVPLVWEFIYMTEEVI